MPRSFAKCTTQWDATFGHAVIRQALYGELTTTRRVRLHRLAGDAIAASYGGDSRRFAELARHYFEAAVGGTPGGGLVLPAGGECALNSKSPGRRLSSTDRALHVIDEHETEIEPETGWEFLHSVMHNGGRQAPPRPLPTLEKPRRPPGA